MLKEIKRFYKKVENKRFVEDLSGEVPITFTYVFHKGYPRLPQISLLINEDKDSQFETLLGIRESTRIFSDTPVKIEELSKILRSCRIVDANRNPERRTYPSGGARFPVELYLIAYNLEGVDGGAYHYDMVNRNLELLLKENLKTKRRELISPYLENPAATIIFTSVLARAEVKYMLRAYPYSLIEAGHMGQNIHLACAELGIGSCSVSGFVDDTIKKILDLTEDEIPIYSISIGRKKTLI